MHVNEEIQLLTLRLRMFSTGVLCLVAMGEEGLV